MKPPWMLPGWSDEATTWIRAELETLDIQVTGAIEDQRVQPWSIVQRVPASSGTIYFKATNPAYGYETGLTKALAEWRPDCMPDVLAADLDRKWMLMRDAGPTLRSLIKPTRDIKPWQRILPMYAELQIEMVARVPDLLALGTLDRRLAGLPQQVVRMVEDEANIPLDRPDNLTTEEYQQVRALMPQYGDLCARLADFGLPETLHHDDFHDANILVQDGRFTFSDWGDSCVTFPFFSMLVTLNSIVYHFELEENGPEVNDLRDIYLEPWTRYAPANTLRQAFALAIRAAMPNRALTWYAEVSVLDEPLKAEHIEAVPGWLQNFLHASRLSHV